jgi:hypothetical protein
MTRLLLAAWMVGAWAATRAPAAAPVDPPAAPGSLAPNLAAAGETVLLSWLEPTAPGGKPGETPMALRFAAFDGRRWSGPRTVVSSPKILANWADFPALARSKRGWLVAGWPERSGSGAYDYLLELARAESTESSWNRIGTAHEDRSASEHGFVSFVPESDAVRAFWLDGRQMQGDRGSMSLRTARIGEAPDLSELLDARVCDCCQISAALGEDGPLVVYRDRSDKEIRDIAIVRRVGGKWRSPQSIASDGWKIDGCPVNGPAVAASGRRVAVAWFTGARDRARVSLANSSDGGETFSGPISVDESSPAGRVAVALAGNGDAIVAWVATEGKGGSIRIRRVDTRGRVGASLSVASTSLARSSGFPRIARLGPAILIAWVEASDPFRLRAATIAETRLPATR